MRYSMRYRIIKEANLNDEFFYEVHFYEQVKYLYFFKCWKWVPAIEHERRAEWWFSRTRTARYSCLEEAQRVVNRRATKRLVAQEGEIEQDRSYRIVD